MQLSDYGYTGEPAFPDGARPARVTAAHRDRFALITDSGTLYGRVKAAAYRYGAEEYPTVGDFVAIRHEQAGDAVICRTLPRRMVFRRADPSGKGHAAQALAANIDTVFLVTSLNMDLNPRRIERYLTQTYKSGARPVVVLTKADVGMDVSRAEAALLGVCAGVDILAVSAMTGAGMDALSSYLKPGETVVFLGSSGVGKSTLLNALMRREVMVTSGIREDDDKGRHTTTHRELFLLPCGTAVIDTPGMRELGAWDAAEGVAETFEDIEQLAAQCRFSDCRHESEPHCAVKAALKDGTLSRARFDNYLRLRREAERHLDGVRIAKLRRQILVSKNDRSRD